MIFGSWEIMNDTIAVKKSDRSFFEYKGSGIPKETRCFWEVENLKPTEKKYIKLLCQKIEYDAYIQLEDAGKRTRIFWHSDLHRIFLNNYPDYDDFVDDYPLFMFKKIETNKYEVSFVPGNTALNEHDYEVYESIDGKKEGKQKVYYSTKYERNPKNRKEAIKFHGLKCKACGFNFSDKYGDLGQGFIEVHHIRPLFSLDKEITINPKTDLVPVCSNCHRMIHRARYKTYSISEIKTIIQKQKLDC